ncbi:unnamed protein product [Arabis nemorensis]|uniref:SKP1 component dimerisation domain-containing protein n=1 Tax=Arabis nemorensis TaxID=586526 RepID=A0A565BAU9_9BRAS|nr:unnamed protein product [Arabis nemorensis]
MKWAVASLDVKNKRCEDKFQAAEKLQVKGLLDLAAEIMARNIEGKTVEEIRDMLGFGNDFSSEEESDPAKKKKLRKALLANKFRYSSSEEESSDE